MPKIINSKNEGNQKGNIYPNPFIYDSYHSIKLEKEAQGTLYRLVGGNYGMTYHQIQWKNLLNKQLISTINHLIIEQII